MNKPLWKALDVRPGVTAIIGSGGKTSLMLQLCRELPGRVVVCTSTHIRPPEELPLYTGPLEKMPVEKLCTGTPCEDGKLTAPPDSFEYLAQLADYVLVEADGSKGLPLKAHLSYEPVIPACAAQVIGVLGLSGLGRPISEAAHRPEVYARLCGCAPEELATPARAAIVLQAEGLHTRLLLNQAEGPRRFLGEELAKHLSCPVLLNSFREGWYQNG